MDVREYLEVIDGTVAPSQASVQKKLIAHYCAENDPARDDQCTIMKYMTLCPDILFVSDHVPIRKFANLCISEINTVRQDFAMQTANIEFRETGIWKAPTFS